MDYKKDFPIFTNHPELTYLDTAASAQKPQEVIDALKDFYENTYANVHRGIYKISEEATEQFENVRKKAAQFINAQTEKEIIFTSGTTRGINMVVQSFGMQNIQEGDEILITELEHHSNYLPWKKLAQDKHVNLIVIPWKEVQEAQKYITQKTKMVAISMRSNVLGIKPNVEEIIQKAHEVGAVVLLDAAQEIAHAKIDVQGLDADFLAFGAHKMYGPTGIGVLYAKMKHLQTMEPVDLGGGMAQDALSEKIEYQEIPERFEAGTQSIAQIIGMGKAMTYLENIGFDNIQKHEKEISEYTLKALSENKNIQVLSPKETQGVISFVHKTIHPHDLTTLLDEKDVAIRAGHHCAQPLMKALGQIAVARISIGIYTTKEDIDRCMDAMKYAEEILR